VKVGPSNTKSGRELFADETISHHFRLENSVCNEKLHAGQTTEPFNASARYQTDAATGRFYLAGDPDKNSQRGTVDEVDVACIDNDVRALRKRCSQVVLEFIDGSQVEITDRLDDGSRLVAPHSDARAHAVARCDHRATHGRWASTGSGAR
jgi:hypothetical protein